MSVARKTSGGRCARRHQWATPRRKHAPLGAARAGQTAFGVEHCADEFAGCI